MDYTEADAKGWAETVAAKLRGAPELGKDWWAALRLLEAAALEGAKVPGLVADNAALKYLFRRLRLVYGLGRAGFTPSDALLADLDAAITNHSPGAALLAEHAREVSALQAQVAELAGAKADAVLASSEQRARAERAEASLRQEQATVASLRQHVVEIRSERDALRAQVTPMREALEWIERETHPEDGLTFERIHAKAAGALSAPPAETKGVKS